MKKIGIIFGMENTFPEALVARINSMTVADVSAEFVKIGEVSLTSPIPYRVIIDRISHDIAFYRAYLKKAAFEGTIVINNPFWWSADDKFFNYVLANRLGVAVPETVILPHKQHPVGTTDQSMRNLEYPLPWDDIFQKVGFPAYLKPFNGGGWRDVYRVNSREEFFHAYDRTGDLCMTLQKSVNFKEYFRCYVVGQKQVRVMQYDPRRPHAERYLKNAEPLDPKLLERVERDALTLCRALGYDLNTVEFAVEDGIPYAIDFMNPAPDADYHSVGHENFEWIVNALADLAVEKVLSNEHAPSNEHEKSPAEYRWSEFLKGTGNPVKTDTPARSKASRQRATTSKRAATSKRATTSKKEPPAA